MDGAGWGEWMVAQNSEYIVGESGANYRISRMEDI